jgi:hypothetical protein
MRNTSSHYRPVGTQTVSYTASSAKTSTAVSSGIHAVRLVATTSCHYAIGDDPTATTSDAFLPAEVIEYISIGEGEKVAFIRDSADGTAFVTEVSQ